MSNPPYPKGPFTDEFVIGGPNGGDFATVGWVDNEKADVVKKFQMWWNDSTMTGIQVTYTDGSVTEIFGSTAQNTDAIAFAPGELITSATLWDNGNSTRFGHIRITTSAGQVYDNGKNVIGQPAYAAGVGSGLLVGFVGRRGKDLDMLGLIFVKPQIVSVSITDVKYTPALVGSKAGLSEVVLSAAHFEGKENVGTDYNFQDSVTLEQSSTFTQSSSTTFGVSVEVTVSASLFDIVKVDEKTGFTWQKTDEKEVSTSNTSDSTLSWGVSGHLEPKENLECKSVCEQGIGSANYTSNVKITLAKGPAQVFTESGRFENVINTQAWVTETFIKPPPTPPTPPTPPPPASIEEYPPVMGTVKDESTIC